MKQNCWEVNKCGREQGGIRELELGVCPASLETRLDGVHHGKNAGRCCWIISGTLCQGKPQGTFVQKYNECEKCGFYNKVQHEEYPNFYLAAQLLKKLK